MSDESKPVTFGDGGQLPGAGVVYPQDAPKFAMSFLDGAQEIGTLTVKDGAMSFDGEADEAARVFFERVVKLHVEDSQAREVREAQATVDKIKAIIVKHQHAHEKDGGKPGFARRATKEQIESPTIHAVSNAIYEVVLEDGPSGLRTGYLLESLWFILRALQGFDEETIAQRFHETYERLAPSYGYKTREASAVPWKDVPKSNRDLMMATVREVLASGKGLEWND